MRYPSGLASGALNAVCYRLSACTVQGSVAPAMFGFLKNLRKKTESEAAPERREQVVSASPNSPKATATPAVAASVPAGEVIEIPLNALLQQIPVPVQSLVTNRGATLRLPVALITAQLPRGGVSVTLAQLREFTVPPAVNVPPDQGSAAVPLPLSEILPRLKQGAFQKRAQRKVEISAEVTDLFSKVDKDAMIVAPVVSNTPAFPVFPVAGTPPLAEVPPAKVPDITPLTDVKAPALETPPIKTNVVLPPPPTAPKEAAPPALEVPQAPRDLAVPGIPDNAITVAMSLMTSHFAATGKTELSNLHKATVAFPPDELESALKKGKLSFPWSKVKHWIVGADNLPNLAADSAVEFPLNVVAPIFLHSRKVYQPRRKVAANDSIPDLFTKPVAAEQQLHVPADPPPVGPPPVAPVAPVEPPVMAATPPILPPSGPAAAVPGPTPKPVMDYGEIFGMPDRKNWTLAEVMDRVVQLRGVSGAVIATGDGLLVSGRWPNGIAAEAAAGFAPSLFGRVAQYSKDLKIGEPGQFTILVEQTPLQVFKTGPNYLMILGKPGEPLPKIQLTALALRLAQP
jgi:predicted regulator of Ras-like GTPase activity (Roadblock/LC7/MglB family)